MSETRNDNRQNNDNKQNDGKFVQFPQASCSKSFSPWIWTLLILAILTLGWSAFENYRDGGMVRRFFRTDDFSKMFDRKPDTAPNYYSTVAQSAPVRTIQDSYHGIIDVVRPALISIDVAVDPQRQVDPQAVVGSQNIAAETLVAGAPVVNYNRVGSGVIIEPRGYVLTSYHVIDGAVALKGTVYGPGGAMDYPLKVVNVDRQTDLALLRLIGDGPFPNAILGNSDAARTGDVVLALGSPFGFDQTVTIGIISSRNRTLNIGGRIYENMIQTDTSINKGNSGGPLVNVNGEVIGINTAIYSPTGVFSGVGFAIPVESASSLVAGVVDFANEAPTVNTGQLAAWRKSGRQVGNAFKLPNGQMLTPPHPFRGKCIDCHPQLCPTTNAANATFVAGQGADLEPFMGAVLTDVDRVIAKQFNLLHPGGLLVNKVYPGTAADEAGLLRGDIIMRADGRKIQNIVDFRAVLATKKPGDIIEIVTNNNGARKTLQVRLNPMPPFMPPKIATGKPIKEFDWLGAEISPIPASLAGFINRGVYVADADGILARSGVIKGDVIQAVNKRPVEDMMSFIAISKDANVLEGILLEVIRSGQPMYITVKK
jgi:S1-C subfamily serine protease